MLHLSNLICSGSSIEGYISSSSWHFSYFLISSLVLLSSYRQTFLLDLDTILNRYQLRVVFLDLASAHFDNTFKFQLIIQKNFDIAYSFGAVSDALVVIPDFNGRQVGAQCKMNDDLKMDWGILWQWQATDPHVAMFVRKFAAVDEGLGRHLDA